MKRIYELDLLRGIGIIAVVIFHFAWNICSKYKLEIINSAWVGILVNIFSGMLIFVSGASAQLGRNTLKRGLAVFGCGLIVTAATYIVIPDSFIRFGILHLLGVSMITAAAVKKLGFSGMITGCAACVFIAAGIFVSELRVNTPYLFWLGLVTENYSAADHFPVLPWMGIFFAGYTFSVRFYKDRRSPFTKGRYKNNLFSAAGRHSLAVYMIHQPILQLILYIPFVQKFLNAVFLKNF